MPRSYKGAFAKFAQSVVGTNGIETRLASMDLQLDRLTRNIAELAPQALGSSPLIGAADSRPAIDSNLMLHQGRGALLREMPPGARRLLSAGCAGAWYFKWVEQCYGRAPQHLGIEYYAPKPPDLPTNVTWISNTASNMEGIETGSCDLVFSGQNIEHLWREEVAGFLIEAARVVKPGGYLVVDSPNRDLTKLLCWSHPEHTIEFTVSEIRRLFELAGFDVTKLAGIWLCRDPKAGRVMPFDPNDADSDWSMVERIVAARDYPEHSFLWWMEGRRSDRAPNRTAIESLLAEAYQHAWPERTQRMIVPAGRKIESRQDGEWVVAHPGDAGTMIFGPYMPLRAGRHRVTFSIVPDPGTTGVFAVCDVCVGPDAKVLQRREVMPGTREIAFELELPAMEFGGQFRCFSTTGGFAVRRVVCVEETLA